MLKLFRRRLSDMVSVEAGHRVGAGFIEQR